MLEIVITKSKTEDKKYDAIIDGKKLFILGVKVILILRYIKMKKERIDT